MTEAIETQFGQLQHPVDRLWWLAQFERGVEASCIDREPKIGSERVLKRLVEVQDTLASRERISVRPISVNINVSH